MIGGNVVNSFSNNFIKGEMKIKSIKILKTSYFVRLSVILNLFLNSICREFCIFAKKTKRTAKLK